MGNALSIFTAFSAAGAALVFSLKTGQLMLYRELIAVCSVIHTKHTNTVCVGRT